MLSIRMQRLGRKGHPVYRVVVQDSRQTPTSGKYVALLGSYDPHTKTTTLAKDKAEHYLKHGAQPSERVVKLFTAEKVKLPKWAEKPVKQKREIRNPDKLRRNRPADAPAPEKPADEAPAEEPATETVPEETKVAETKPDEKPEEQAVPAEEPSPAEPEAEEAPDSGNESDKPAEEPSPEPEAEAEQNSDSTEKTA